MIARLSSLYHVLGKLARESVLDYAVTRCLEIRVLQLGHCCVHGFELFEINVQFRFFSESNLTFQFSCLRAAKDLVTGLDWFTEFNELQIAEISLDINVI
jgi:hypothetical protein